MANFTFPQNDIASYIFGSISIGCWIVVLAPQLYKNYKRKSSDSISTTFLLIWFAGDMLNLAGALLQNLLLTMILLASYYIFQDTLILTQVYYYRKFGRNSTEDEITVICDDTEETPLVPMDHKSSSPAEIPQQQSRSKFPGVLELLALVSCIGLTGMLVLYHYNDTPGSIVNDDHIILWKIKSSMFNNEYTTSESNDSSHVVWLAQSLGWGSALLYLGSRIPQILMNFQNRSCEGLSIAMFVFAVLGNSTYFLSILFHSVEREFILMNLPWLIGSGGTLFFDFIIFFQFYLYRNPQYSPNSSPMKPMSETTSYTNLV
ncbi:hypothetical protein G9A89_002166 [Geosiphon pyriformis]|nr:hypothetical protein G9A89_002166 [Geosiphon pyriformis]